MRFKPHHSTPTSSKQAQPATWHSASAVKTLPLNLWGVVARTKKPTAVSSTAGIYEAEALEGPCGTAAAGPGVLGSVGSGPCLRPGVRAPLPAARTALPAPSATFGRALRAVEVWGLGW